MYPVSTQGEPSRLYNYNTHHDAYANDHAHLHAYHRPPIELPRPLEPRPSLHTSLSDSSGLQRRNEAFRGPLSPQYRSQGQNLPALREILSPGPEHSRRQSYGSIWNSNSGPSTSHHGVEGHYAHSGMHPPMALYPAPEHTGRYHPPQTTRFEVPILESNPVTNSLPQSIPISPYVGYQDTGRSYTDVTADRHAPISTSSSMVNGYTSPYGPSGGDDVQYRSPIGPNDRGSATYPPTSAESGKRYLGVKDVPGEGRFHVYEGGHRIPTHVDGETVNPQWGLTKANKPRKRLALACLDCREKKIKCEPGTKSCVQCEKANRTCRRAPVQASQSDTTTPQPWPGTASSEVRPGASISDPTPTSNRDTEPDPLNKRRTRHDPSPPNVPSKKHRSASPVATNQDVECTLQDGSRTPTMQAYQGNLGSSAPQWDDDPYAVDPELTLHLLDLYFAHINSATYCLYPQPHFINWVKNYPNKCQNERMALYAILAIASIFADERLAGFGKQCARVAGDAVSSQVGKHNIAVAQTKLLLALYHFSKGNMELAWEHNALRTITYMRLNTEEGCLDDAVSLAQSRVEFGFSREQLAECKRRTFWSAFLMDRYCGAAMCILKPQDTFVRLPCTDDMYARSIPSDAPYLANEIIDPSTAIITPTSPLAPIAWLALVAAIWGDVNDFVFRAPHRPAPSYQAAYKSFYEDISNRLQGWSSRLPPHLQYREENMDRSIQQGYAGTFISMHTLHHFTQMKLNRHLRHSVLPEYVERNVQTAHYHAHRMLQLMNAIRMANKTISAPAEGQLPSFWFSTPFPGHATLTAIDIVGAGDWETSLRTTLEEIFGALGTIRELSKYWDSAKHQLRACEKRHYTIQNLVTRPTVRGSAGAWLGRRWGMELPMERDLEPEHDCIYGLGESGDAVELYFGALKDQDNTSRAPSGGLRIV